MAKLARLNGNYVYTRDNFIKSVIILAANFFVLSSILIYKSMVSLVSPIVASF